MLKSIFTLFFFLFTLYPIFAQKLAEDTAFFDFFPLSHLEPSPCIGQIKDSRNMPPAWISTGSKKRLLLIPVDVFISNKEPIASVLMKGFSKDSAGLACYDMNLRQLDIHYRSGLFFPSYVFRGIIELYKKQADTSLFAGTLVYNEDFKKLRGEDILDACPRILYQWYPQFQRDVLEITWEDKLNSGSAHGNHWIGEEVPPSERLSGSITGTVGLNWWQMEAELWFAAPETHARQVFTTSLFRYQNHKEFECIAFGKGTEHLRYRFSKNITYDGSFSFLIGINKWKNMEESNPGLLQIPQLNFSSMHGLVYQTPNSRGILFKTGLQGNFYYIYEKSPGIQIGFYLGAGYIL